jgi:hypothetical protein
LTETLSSGAQVSSTQSTCGAGGQILLFHKSGNGLGCSGKEKFLDPNCYCAGILFFMLKKALQRLKLKASLSHNKGFTVNK